MTFDSPLFECSFPFLSDETNARLEILRGTSHRLLRKIRKVIGLKGWVEIKGERVMACWAQGVLHDQIVAMTETLYQTAGNACAKGVGLDEYNERVIVVEKKLLAYADAQWRQLTRGLPLQKAAVDPIKGVRLAFGRGDRKSKLAEHIRRKRVELELRNWKDQACGELGLGTSLGEPTSHAGLVAFLGVKSAVRAENPVSIATLRRGDVPPWDTDAMPTLTTGRAKLNRRGMVDAFLLECNQQLPFKVLRRHISCAVSHKSPRQFQYWQGGYEQATPMDDANFRRILAKSPKEFHALLIRLRVEGVPPADGR